MRALSAYSAVEIIFNISYRLLQRDGLFRSRLWRLSASSDVIVTPEAGVDMDHAFDGWQPKSDGRGGRQERLQNKEIYVQCIIRIYNCTIIALYICMLLLLLLHTAEHVRHMLRVLNNAVQHAEVGGGGSSIPDPAPLRKVS